MALSLISLLWFAVVTVFLYHLVRVFFSRASIPPPPDGMTQADHFVTIIVPARNEEKNIEGCLLSLLRQNYPAGRYRVIAVDDHSTDSTPEIISGLCRQYPHLESATVDELPEGWTGKNHACRHGARLAAGRWIGFIDADTESKPDLIRSAVSFADSDQIDLLSLSPFQKLLSWQERLFLPAVFLMIASSIDVKRINERRRPEAIANGQFLFFRKKAYDALGGHSSVKGEIMEDVAFAELVKQKGFRLFFAFGDSLISTRMYRNLRQLWEGFSKNLATLLKIRGYPRMVAVSLRSIAIGWGAVILPVWAWVDRSALYAGFSRLPASIVVFLAASSLIMMYLATLRELRVPLPYVLGMPIGFTLLSALIVNSVIRHRKGEKRWKGRTYS